MRRWNVVLASAFAAFNLQAAENSSAPDPNDELPIEPLLLIAHRAADGSLIVPKASDKSAPSELNLERLESDLARAKRNAGSGDRLYRAGIISKVEAEDRVLRVVRIEEKIAEARLEKTRGEPERASDANKETLVDAEAAAAHATDERRRAELEAALRNLQRQQKLLALGSARKADVTRAEQKLAELQRPPN